MRKKWLLYEEDKKIVESLVDTLDISSLTAKVLCHRGISNIEEAEVFLDPENRQKFHDPFTMKGMPEAVDRIIKAINGKEKIVIYGDYDVDGITSSAIMVRTLRKLGAVVNFYIPSREEGYGFNVPALQNIVDEGVNLLISVDCGISNVKEIEEVKDQIDVIVTDHHLPSDPINNAISVIDPHQEDCTYPDKNLCGAGVAFKICQALNAKIKGIDFHTYVDDIDLVALATVADIVPLVGENRKIVYLGLKHMPKTSNIGLRALIETAGLSGKTLNTNHLGYKLAPRLNAVGRLTYASEGVKLLLSENQEEAKTIAQKLDEENNIRKDKETRMVDEANEKYKELRKERGGDMSSIIVASDKWHPGVIGLAAARLLEKYYLPTIVLSIQGEYARASCRSIDALHMKHTLDHFKDYFTQYGGHSKAAGFTMMTKDLEKFRDEFDSYVKQNLKEEDFIPVQKVDALIHPTELNVKLAKEMDKIAPFGVDNPQPVFACKNVKGVYPKAMGQEQNHLSFFIKSDDANFDIRAVAWSKSSFIPLIENELIDIIFEPELNTFNEKVSVQCMVKSIDPSEETGAFPNREIMISIYKFLWRYSNELNYEPYDICQFNVGFRNSEFASKNPKLNSTYTMLSAVQVFEELGLIHFNSCGDSFIMPKSSRKLNLDDSRFWRINHKSDR
ncbi:MAG: single-stranded-DNA-specific exonuclease RecJ [Selenomonadaceae bacterium]|nr:single-stranded-DNA-specific exonuclease RecJ [Selenomonadaceae bacterium]